MQHFDYKAAFEIYVVGVLIGSGQLFIKPNLNLTSTLEHKLGVGTRFRPDETRDIVPACKLSQHDFGWGMCMAAFGFALEKIEAIAGRDALM